MLTAQNFARRGALGRLAAVLIAAALLTGCAAAPLVAGPPGRQPSTSAPASAAASAPPLVPLSAQPADQSASQPPNTPTVLPPAQPSPQPTDKPWVPGSLITPGLDLRAGPVDVPLELQIPLLQVSAPVIGVGITSLNAMDAPKGPIGDRIWQSAFWYRGGGIPGDLGTATFAGHVDDPLARPAVFARLTDLRPGDVIIIHDIRSGRDIHFSVTRTAIYSTQQAADPAVLAQIYGSGPVAGRGPQPAPDGLAHLTLITCAGDIVNGAFDHHVVVYAARTD